MVPHTLPDVPIEQIAVKRNRAHRLVVERGAPISAELHDLLIELLAASDWANTHDDDLAVLARLRT